MVPDEVSVAGKQVIALAPCRIARYRTLPLQEGRISRLPAAVRVAGDGVRRPMRAPFRAPLQVARLVVFRRGGACSARMPRSGTHWPRFARGTGPARWTPTRSRFAVRRNERAPDNRRGGACSTRVPRSGTHWPRFARHGSSTLDPYGSSEAEGRGSCCRGGGCAARRGPQGRRVVRVREGWDNAWFRNPSLVSPVDEAG